jgi:Mrp family chromosome partitioning ATPase
MSEAIENCTHNCSTCGASCGSRAQDKSSFLEPLHEGSSVKKVIGIVSGKGGVGKSLVTSLMAVKMNSLGKRTAILDADITGPSIPKAFGLDNTGLSISEQQLMIPATTATGIQVVSSNLLLANETDPVIWRGAMIAGAVKQFWSEVLWKDIDYMFVDMPPGTGDVPLTVFQSLPVAGIIIVTSPQELVSMIVAKAVNMAAKMDVPVLGLVENMSYLTCPDCGKKISIFGESHIDEIAKEHGLDVLARIPIDPEVAAHVDEGTIEYLERDWMDMAAEKVARL